MTKQDVERLIAGLPSQIEAVGHAMTGRIEEAFKNSAELRLFSFAVPQSQMTSEVYDHFRPSDWFIVSVPDAFFGQGMERATIRKKCFVLPSPGVCYHATPLTNRQSIERSGLLPGFKCNKQSRGKMFADSPYYIYASLSEREAQDWCRRFAEESFLVYPVQVGKAGIRLFVDPASVDEMNKVISGYIIDSPHVPPELLDSPVLVEKGCR
jgi:hypothetical protein